MTNSTSLKDLENLKAENKEKLKFLLKNISFSEIS